MVIWVTIWAYTYVELDISRPSFVTPLVPSSGTNPTVEPDPRRSNPVHLTVRRRDRGVRRCAPVRPKWVGKQL